MIHCKDRFYTGDIWLVCMYVFKYKHKQFVRNNIYSKNWQVAETNDYISVSMQPFIMKLHENIRLIYSWNLYNLLHEFLKNRCSNTRVSLSIYKQTRKVRRFWKDHKAQWLYRNAEKTRLIRHWWISIVITTNFAVFCDSIRNNCRTNRNNKYRRILMSHLNHASRHWIENYTRCIRIVIFGKKWLITHLTIRLFILKILMNRDNDSEYEMFFVSLMIQSIIV